MKYFLYILLALVIIVLVLAWYLGMFSKYEVTEREVGPNTVAYAEFVGPYAKTGPVMNQVRDDLVAEDIKPTSGFGLYFDNPKTTPKEELRSEVGSIIAPEDIAKLTQSGEKYKVKTIEKKNSLVLEFPYKNMLSFMIGPMKAYSVMEKYMAEKGIEWTEDMSTMEIYDIKNKMITYIVGIE